MSDPSPPAGNGDVLPSEERKQEAPRIPGSGALTAAFDSLVAAAGVDEIIASRHMQGEASIGLERINMATLVDV